MFLATFELLTDSLLQSCWLRRKSFLWVKLTVGFRRAGLLSLGLAAVKLSFPTFCRLAKVSWYAERLDSASADSLLRHSDPPPLRSRLGPSSRSFPSKGVPLH